MVRLPRLSPPGSLLLDFSWTALVGKDGDVTLALDGEAYEGDVSVKSFPESGGVKNGKTD